jgi:hypothetical protein
MTDSITSQYIDLFSWITLYINCFQLLRSACSW